MKRVPQSEFESFCVNSFPSWVKFEGNVLGTDFQCERFLRKNVPTYLSRTHHTNAVVGVFQSLFIGNKLSFLEKYLVFGFVFSAEKSERLGGLRV